jgi:hypothetical protein
MPWLKPVAGGEPQYVPAAALQKAVATGLYEPPEGDAPVTVVDPATGLASDVAARDLAAVQQTTGYPVETPEGFRERERATRVEREQGGLLGMAKTGAESFAAGATLGGSELLFGGLGEDYREARRDRKEANPGTDIAANVLGAVVPVAASGGTGALGAVARATPVGLAARGAGAVGRAAGGGVRGAVAAGTIEGAAQGAGTVAADVALADSPEALERALGAIPSHVLFGGLAGGGVSGLFSASGKVLGKGLQRGRAYVEEARVANAKSMTPEAQELAGKSADELVPMQRAEVESLVAKQAADKADAAKAITAYRTSKTTPETNPFHAVEDKEIRNVLRKADNKVRGLLDNPRALEKKPDAALDAFQREEQALLRAKAKGPSVIKNATARHRKLATEIGEELDTLPDNVSTVTLAPDQARKYADWTDTKLPRNQPKIVARDEAARFRAALEAGEVTSATKAAVQHLDTRIAENRAIQQHIERTMLTKADLTSPRLAAIQDALEIAKTPAPPQTLGQQATFAGMMSMAAGILPGGPLGAVGLAVAPALVKKAGDMVFRRAGKATAESAARSAAAIDAFVGVAKKVTRPAPVLASKVLTSVSYGEAPKPTKGAPPPTAGKGKGRELVAAFKAREAEIRAQTTLGPAGKIVMRADARRKMAEQFAAVRAVHALAADKLETLAARRLEFLADKLPKRPDIAAVQIGGPDTWQPSDMDMRKFARYAAAVEDPGGVEERLANGTVTSEDAEAYKAVYPERFEAFKMQLIERLPELRARLPYERRLAMSIFTGVPVVPAMEPRILAVLQGQYKDEPGSEGGMQAPAAAPQFGSVTKPEQTPAQERAQ